VLILRVKRVQLNIVKLTNNQLLGLMSYVGINTFKYMYNLIDKDLIDINDIVNLLKKLYNVHMDIYVKFMFIFNIYKEKLNIIDLYKEFLDMRNSSPDRIKVITFLATQDIIKDRYLST